MRTGWKPVIRGGRKRILLLGFLLERERGAADLDLVAGAEAVAGDAAAVDEGRAAEGEVFEVEAAGDDVDGGVAAADGGVLEQVDVAVGARADVRRRAVEDELLAGDEALDDLEPAGLGGVLDQARGEAGDQADGDGGDGAGEDGAAAPLGDGGKEEPADDAADQSADQADAQLLDVAHQHAGGDHQEQADDAVLDGVGEELLAGCLVRGVVAAGPLVEAVDEEGDDNAAEQAEHRANGAVDRDALHVAVDQRLGDGEAEGDDHADKAVG